MKIGTLKTIGEHIHQEVHTAFCEEAAADVVAVGAAGDRTHRIDVIAEEIVIASLEKTGEPLTIISEEAGIVPINGGGPIVLVDPIDGSRNAISGIPFFGISIAVADGPRLSDVFLVYLRNLANGDTFWAERGSGAWMNDRKIASQQDTNFLLIAFEAPSPGRDIPALVPLLAKARKARCFGATALDLAYLARGAISVFATMSKSRTFDFAGGWLLVREAGGIVTDTEGNDIGHVQLGLERSTSLLAAANAELHRKALAALKG